MQSPNSSKEINDVRSNFETTYYPSRAARVRFDIVETQSKHEFPFTKMELKMQTDNVMDDTHDNVNHPSHYTKHPSGVECITITEHMTFNQGNAVKYLWRMSDKGDPVENLQKAIWYCQREIERIAGQKATEEKYKEIWK